MNTRQLFTLLPAITLVTTTVSLAQLVQGGAGDTPVPIVASYEMEPDAQDASKLIDAGPLGCSGTVEGLPVGVSAYVDGHVGKALHLNGETMYGKIGNWKLDMVNQLSDQFTISAWINPDNLSHPMPILAKRFQNVGQPFALMLTVDGRVAFSGCNGPAWYNFSSDKANIPAQQWTYVAFTFKKGAGCTFYVNGSPTGKVAAEKVPSSVLPNTQHMLIGSEILWNSNSRKMEPVKFAGSIDALHIYPIALTDEQVKLDMDNKLKTRAATNADCVLQ